MLTRKRNNKFVLTILLFLLSFNLVFVPLLATKTLPAHSQEPMLQITSTDSLVHLGSIDSFDITEGGTQAGKFLLDALENDNMNSATAAIQVYNRIIPVENFGGEYTALKWFAEYLLAPDQAKANFIDDKITLEFFNFFAYNDFANLKEYIQRKYKLKEFSTDDENQARETFLEDFILFNNPQREEWEQSSKIMEIIDLKPGDRVADIGSGPGYYTFRFSQLVGKEGQIFSIDTVQNHLNYITKVSQKYGINNIEPVHLKKTDHIGIGPNQVDMAFMCSLYHIIYMTSIEYVKDRYVESIKQALKPGGTFVLVDNALVKDRNLPYHGPYIAKELIIAQLEYYGFELVADYSFIPQRYVLVFKVKQS